MKILGIRNILLFILAFFKVSFSPKKKKIKIPNRIMVIQPAKLGDMVCTTPMFRAIKQKFPHSKLYVMGDKINKELLDGNKDVDEYMVFDRNDSIFKLGNKLKKENIAVCIIVGPDYVALLWAIFSGIRSIVAPRPVGGVAINTRTYSMLMHFVHTREFRFGAYAPLERLKLLEPLDIFTEDTTKHLSFSVEADKKVSNFLKKMGISFGDDFIVGISPSAGNKIKKWSEENFAKLADHIYKKHNAKIIVIGGPNDIDEVKRMMSLLDSDTEVINTLNIFNVDALMALMSKMHMFISVDTGPIYIAEAFKVPTVDITGPIDEKEQPPIGKFHRVVTPKSRKKPELHVMNAREYNRGEALRQIESITVDMVVNEVDKLFIEINKKLR